MLARIDENAARPEGEAASNGSEHAHPTVVPPSPAPAPAPAAQAPVTAISNDIKATPVAAAIITDKKVDAASITPSGAGGKILKHDVLDALAHPGRIPGKDLFTRVDRREKMSNLRKTNLPPALSKQY